MSKSIGRLIGVLWVLSFVSIEGYAANLTLETQCVLVSDGDLFGSNPQKVYPNLPACSLLSTHAEGLEKPADLIGTGDLIIAVDKTEFENVVTSNAGVPGQFLLFLNGVALPNDASIVAREQVGTSFVLRYRIRQGAETQQLWSVLYADGALLEPHKLNAALGWRANDSSAMPMLPVRSTISATVSITTVSRMAIALVLVLLAIGAIVYIGITTDTLRDAPDSAIPTWWSNAHRLKKALAGISNEEARKELLSKVDPNYNSTPQSAYDDLAEFALAGRPPSEAEIVPTTVGLALQKYTWQPLRASYSLSRTQMALWFTFAVATGLFLWLLYGDLRRIDGSLLALLGISVTTAGISWVTDRNANNGRDYVPSRGFWYDLLTGFDEQRQLHRYQAVVVNILLLVVGIFHVQQQLSYPVFDSTWLIFLGISGTAYGIGKQLLENRSGK